MSDCTLHESQLYFGGEFFMIRRLRFGMNTVSRRPKTIAGANIRNCASTNVSRS